MDTDEFWAVIAAARADIGPDRPFHKALGERLTGLGVPAILAFQERYEHLHRELERWDVWAAGYLIGGGCSDDGFIDFRAGLIALGRDWYERAAADPDGLADHPAVADLESLWGEEPFFYEEVGYAASRAYVRLLGEDADLHRDLAPARTERGPDMGEDFDFDDDAEMRRRLPRLAALLLEPVAG
ncbi:DUF4240 domain-containing protein [Kitasatospora sp. NPDC056783]|uniref:DUF4240 domain-containing protein n=1 Tax=Kitasatospora sp. NPDC056783 TaxID=3345943 RepID=UPI003674C6BF